MKHLRRLAWFAALAVLAGPRISHAQAQTVDTPCAAVTARTIGNVIEIVASNKTSVPLSLALDLTVSGGDTARRKAVRGTLRPRSERTFARITNSAPGTCNCEYSFRYALGDPSARHDDRYTYRLPFPADRACAVGQSFGGSFSHTGTLYYAVDFVMPEGTPVCAAREGFVAATESSHRSGGNDPKYRDKANYVLIEHTDGTIGAYLHLKRRGVLVRPGDSVGRGQVIGYSGDTGWATGPHLHFGVHRGYGNNEMGTSIPVRFETSRGIVKQPGVGISYKPAD